MNNSDWWVEWVDNFALVFALRTDKEFEALLAWQEYFLPYSHDEMDAATRRIAQSGEKLFRMQDMLAALQQAARDLRVESDLKKPRPSDGDLRICPDCGGSAFISVPHPHAVQNGVWTHRTAVGYPCHTIAVLCACPLGTYRHQQGATQMTLAEYEGDNPTWRQQVSEDRRQQQAGQQAQDAAAVADGQVSSPLETVLARMQQRLVDQQTQQQAGFE